MATRHKDVNRRGRDWVEGRLSTEAFFAVERQRARTIAERAIDARIARKLSQGQRP